jgi:hypothetical protein
MLNPRSLDPARPRSQCFDVGHDVLNLRRLEDFLERRHQGVAVLDPSFQRLIGDFISVHRKSSSLGNSLQARSNLFCIVVREMAEPAFLIEHLFASYRGPRRSVAGCFFRSCFCRRILCQKRSSYAQNCNPDNQIIPPHDAPSFLRLWPRPGRSLRYRDPRPANPVAAAKHSRKSRPPYFLHLPLEFPLRTRHKVQVPLMHARSTRTFDPGKTVC